MSMCPTWEDNSIFILNPVFMCFSTKSKDWLAWNQSVRVGQHVYLRTVFSVS